MLVNAMHDESQLFHQEVAALGRLEHSNIVKFLGSGATASGRFVILQEPLGAE